MSTPADRYPSVGPTPPPGIVLPVYRLDDDLFRRAAYPNRPSDWESLPPPPAHVDSNTSSDANFTARNVTCSWKAPTASECAPHGTPGPCVCECAQGYRNDYAVRQRRGLPPSVLTMAVAHHLVHAPVHARTRHMEETSVPSGEHAAFVLE